MKENQQYLLASDTVSGAEGRIVITRNGRLLEVAGMKNITTTASVKTSEMRTIGTRSIQEKHSGVKLTGKGNVYFGSNGSNLFTDLVLEYISTGVMPQFDLAITNHDPANTMGAQVMGYYGCSLTGDIPLSILNDEEDMLKYDFNFSITRAARTEAFKDPTALGTN